MYQSLDLTPSSARSSSKPIGTDSRFGPLWVGASSTNQPTVGGTNFWAQGVEVGAGTQQLVAAIRDATGNVGRATNSVVVRVATSASYGSREYWGQVAFCTIYRSSLMSTRSS